MKRFILVVLFYSFVNLLFAGDFHLQTGDLLFQMGESSGLSDAIAEVTTGKDEINYTHVGIVSIENDTVFVLEATTPTVCKTPVDSFLNKSAFVEGKPLVTVARLKPECREIIPQAIVNASKYIGKPYDYVYAPDNDAYYCSELVYISFLDENGFPVFESKKMTFCDEEGNLPAYWIEHFKKYRAEIPEGCEGTNPGDLSKSEVIEIVYRYFENKHTMCLSFDYIH
jgi:hypothetical protein